GADFQEKIVEFTHGGGNYEERALKANDLLNRARAFLLRLLEETEKRLPPNMDVFKQISFFNPALILGPQSPMFSDMPFIECVVYHEDINDLEEQWRQMTFVEWREAGPFKALAEFPTDPVIFWSGVLAHCTDDRMDVDEPFRSLDRIFQKLATFVLGRLTIAHSTAAVERAFSTVSCVTNKVRDPIDVETLESILRSNRRLC
ncbi:MAG: hypothetical protein ACK56I_04080, partial [bacterium]